MVGAKHSSISLRVETLSAQVYGNPETRAVQQSLEEEAGLEGRPVAGDH